MRKQATDDKTTADLLHNALHLTVNIGDKVRISRTGVRDLGQILRWHTAHLSERAADEYLRNIIARGIRNHSDGVASIGEKAAVKTGVNITQKIKARQKAYPPHEDFSIVLHSERKYWRQIESTEKSPVQRAIRVKTRNIEARLTVVSGEYSRN